MKFPYVQTTVKVPVPSLGGGLVRPLAQRLDRRLYATRKHT
jgi:hypothetical protein